MLKSWFCHTVFSSLRSRLMVLVLMAVVPALGLILHTASEQRRTAIAQVEDNLLRLVRFTAANQAQVVEGARQLLVVLSQLPEVREPNIDECNQLLADLLRQYRAYVGFGVLDREGNTLCGAPPATAQIQGSDRLYFQHARDSKDFAIGDYQIGRVTGKPSLSFGYPVLDPSGRVQGVVLAALDLGWLNQFVAEANLPPDAVLTVTDRQGTVLVRYPDSQRWVGTQHQDSLVHQLSQTQPEGTAIEAGLDGVERIYAFTSLGSTVRRPDIFIKIGIPKAVAFAEPNRLLARNLIGLGGVTIAALIAAWVGGEVFLTRKVRALVRATQQLSQGHLHTRTNLAHEQGELGQLAHAFDHMAATLEQREQAIATLNRDLQNRIDELQTLFDVVPIGILIAQDPGFQQVKTNPAFGRILGIDASENASYTASNEANPTYKVFRNGQELTPDELPLRYAALTGSEISGDQIDIVRTDGEVFTLYGYAAPLFDAYGAVRGSIAAFLDITDRIQAEAEREQLLAREQMAREQAETANRIKDEFLAVLSHEIRTPLNPILGWVQMLQTGNLDATKQAIALETIERNVKLQTELIEDLLDISRILRGKMSFNVEPVDLIATIVAAKETVVLAAEAKSLDLSFWVTDSSLNQATPITAAFTGHAQPLSTELRKQFRVMGDANRLQQVVWNLLSNAVKFTPQGGRVEVTLSLVSSPTPGKGPDPKPTPTPEQTIHYAQLTVADTGKGIHPEFLPYVFETFRQADSATTRKFGGLGLGLAIVRHVVEMHGGMVWAESLGEGQGATFTLRLPLLRDVVRVSGVDPFLNSTDPALPTGADLRTLTSATLPLVGVQILLVDDDRDTRELIAFALQQCGGVVTSVGSASEALSAIQRQAPDVLISDIAMPEMDGYMLLEKVQTLAPLQPRPSLSRRPMVAIALTAYAGDVNRQKALQAGFQLHLTKPIEPAELIEAVIRLVDQAAVSEP